MKSLAIIICVLISASLGLLVASAQTTDRITGRITGPNEPNTVNAYEQDTARRARRTVERRNVEAEVEEILADPNTIIANIKEFEGLEDELNQLDDDSSEEERAWLQDRIDNRVQLARDVQRQIQAELMLLRRLASEEGAKKTMAAIDGLLQNRHRRMEHITARIEEERREERQQTQDQRYDSRRRQPRMRGRQPRDAGQDNYMYQEDASRSRRRR
jgi:hypothetical protein